MAAIKELGEERSYVRQSIIFGSDFQGDRDNLRAIGSARRVNPDAEIISAGSDLRPYCITSGAVELEALVRDYPPPAIFVWILERAILEC